MKIAVKIVMRVDKVALSSFTTGPMSSMNAGVGGGVLDHINLILDFG
jgi:hypothetical protein